MNRCVAFSASLFAFVAVFLPGCSDRAAYDAAVIRYHREQNDYADLVLEREDAERKQVEKRLERRQRFIDEAGEDPVVLAVANQLADKSDEESSAVDADALNELDVWLSIQREKVSDAKKAMEALD